MTEAPQKFPKAFTVSFADLDRWDPNSFHNIVWHWPSSVMSEIRTFLTPRRDKVDRSKVAFSDLMPITIHFDGSIEPRTIDEDREYSMELYRAQPGDIVVSKIDLKNGAVSIVPRNWQNVIVTSHFAVYEPDLQKLNPQYFSLLIQASFFQAHLWRNKVGAEGRKEVKLAFFEKLEIPLPPLAIQNTIAAYWEDTQRQLSIAEKSLDDLVDEVNMYMISQTHHFELVTRSRMFLANYATIQQWDVKAGRAAAFISSNADFVRLGDCTDECTETVQPWEDPDKLWPIYGVNNKQGVFLSSKLPGKRFNASYKRIEKNWFFHNPTRANVGSLGIVPEVPLDAITSPEYQVWRLTDSFLPEFMALLIKTRYFLELVAFNRVGGVKQRMYYTNLAEIRLPRAPIELQHQFIDRYRNAIAEISQSGSKSAERKKEIDQMILGTRPV